jgi:hypothetical protein
MAEQDAYIERAKTVFKGAALKTVLAQIIEFFNLKNLCPEIPRHEYKIGDSVVLPKGTLMHGIAPFHAKTKMPDTQVFEFLAENGIISSNWTVDANRNLVSFCASFYRLRENKTLADYIKEYSGLTFRYRSETAPRQKDGSLGYVGEPKLVPVGKLDEFFLSMRGVDYFRIEAETTMETVFLPSLVQDKNQIAFILNGNANAGKKLLANNLDVNNLPKGTVASFINPQGKDLWEERNASGHNRRISYVIFGVPPCMIEGVLVGRKYEKDDAVLRLIKSKLPDSYICDLDGKVIAV